MRDSRNSRLRYASRSPRSYTFLYIDDLDQCEATTVVKVPQAVHFLLAVPLFVVVVGVDSRWIYQALMDEFPELLGPGESATPHDYLEKVFQIPLWLEPLNADTSRRMLQGLVGSESERVANGSASDEVLARLCLRPTRHVKGVNECRSDAGMTRRGESHTDPRLR